MKYLHWKVSICRIGHGFYFLKLYDFIAFFQLGKYRLVLTK